MGTPRGRCGPVWGLASGHGQGCEQFCTHVSHVTVCVQQSRARTSEVHTLLPGGGDLFPPFPRMLVERFSGRFWVWLDREEFLVPKNVLDIVEGQTITWMGLFYCPLLPLLNSVFIFLTFYIKKVRAQGAGGCRGAPAWAP